MNSTLLAARRTRRELLRLGARFGLAAGILPRGVGPPRRAIAAPPVPTGVPLRVLADRIGFYVGSWMGWTGHGLDEIYLREFNMAHMAAGDWPHIEPTRGAREWGQIDWPMYRLPKIVPLIFQGSIYDPAANYKRPNGAQQWLWDLSRADLISALTEFLNDEIPRVRGKIWALTVCGEYNDGADPLHDIIGPEYIDIAYSVARAAAPELLLCYIDYANQVKWGNRYQITKDIVDRLKQQKLIDIVGIEGWMYAGSGQNRWPWKKSELIDGFQSYGLPIALTEFAVLMGDVTGTQEYRYSVEADLYRMAFEAALESGVCNHIMFSAPDDDYSYWGNAPFDINLQPKPSYYAVQSVLQEAVGRKFPNRRVMPQIASDLF